jgi:predicted nucleotidyltransferase
MATSAHLMAEVWLYGSAARGDADELSDVDVLVVGDEPVALDAIGLRGSISASAYSWEEIEHMASYGSLFLHHIKLEGRPLLEERPPRLRRVLETLSPYRRADQELDSFERVVEDAAEAAARGDHSPLFELAVLGTAARHAAILGCYLLGTPEFGRCRPFEILLLRLGYARSAVRDFERLYGYRVKENRGEASSRQPTDTVDVWVPRVRQLISEVKELER